MNRRSLRDRSGRDGERGAALIEFALVFPLLATLLFGTLTGGIVMNRRMAISEGSREGARYGATVPSDQCTPIAVCAGRTWAQQVQKVAVSRSGGAATTSTVCVALVQGPGSAPVPLSLAHTTKATLSPCYVDESADIGKRVQVVITFTDRIQAIVTQIPVAVTVKSIAKLEQ